MNPREIMTPAEVAAVFRVDVKTVVRWADAGRLGSFRTPGGHRRFYADEVRELLAPAGQAKATETAQAMTATARAAGDHPVVIPTRDLTGHTITIERLGDDATTAYNAPVGSAGQLAIVERTGGRFGTIRAVAGVDVPDADMEVAAKASASTLGARFVDARTGAAK